MENVLNVAKYFLILSDPEAGDTISNLKLQKLVYYAQGFHLAIFDRPLFGDTIEAWAHGPVVRSVYSKYADYRDQAIPTPKDFKVESISEEVRDLLDEVYSVFGQFSAWKLRNMTHDEPPWKDAREGNELISQDSMKIYFKIFVND